MKFIYSALLSISLFFCGTVSAGQFSDRNFDQDHMLTTNYNIMVLTALEDQDHITAYTDYGTWLWDLTIHPKVISWKIKDGLLYIFSKSRFLEKTYLTCVDPSTGYVLWEHP